MELYINTLRRRWPLLVALPLLVLLISAAVALREPARYASSVRLLVTRAPQASGGAGLSDRGEDTTAQDLPAIIQSSVFRADLAAELARQGHSVDAAALAATFSEHTVTMTAQAADAASAGALADATIVLLRTQGLRYWGDRAAAQPGLNIGVLDPATPPVQVNGPRTLVLQLALRALLGLAAAAGLALLPGLVRVHEGQ